MKVCSRDGSGIWLQYDSNESNLSPYIHIKFLTLNFTSSWVRSQVRIHQSQGPGPDVDIY